MGWAVKHKAAHTDTPMEPLPEVVGVFRVFKGLRYCWVERRVQQDAASDVGCLRKEEPHIIRRLCD